MPRVTVLLLAAALAMSAACGSSGNPDKSAIEKVIRGQYTAANAGDFDAWSALFTEAGLKHAVPGAADGSLDALRKQWLSRPRTYDLHGVSDIAVNGTGGAATGTISLHLASGDATMVYAVRDHVSKSGTEWKIETSDFVSTALPRGVKVVHITATEFAYDVDTSAMADGKFAIVLQNAGKQTHQIHLVRIAPDLDIDNFLRGGEGSLENVDIGSTSLVAPDESVNVPFSSPLPKGRYVMWDPLPDTDDLAQTPHWQKGMVKEFTVR